MTILFYALRAYSATLPGYGAAPWDTAWYAGIIAHGYKIRGAITDPQNLAFLPLSPYLARSFTKLFHLSVINSLLTTAALSSLIAALLLPLLFDQKPKHDRHASAMTAVVLLFCSPFSIYFLNGYSEAVFLVFAVGFFVAWHRGLRGTAAWLAGFALLARPHGIVLFAAHVFFSAREEGPLLRWPRAVPGLLADAPFMLAPVAAFSTWQYLHFGDPLAYVHALSAWNLVSPWTHPGVLLHMASLQYVSIFIWLAMTLTSLLLWVTRHCKYAIVSLMHLGFVAATLSIENLGRHTVTNVAFAISVGMAAPDLLRMLRRKPAVRTFTFVAVSLALGASLVGFAYATLRFYALQWVS